MTDNTADAMLRLRDAVNDLARLTGTRIDIDIWTHDADAVGARLVDGLPGSHRSEWYGAKQTQREVVAPVDAGGRIRAYELLAATSEVA